MPPSRRRALLLLAGSAIAATFSGPARAQEKVKLFRVITVRDEVTIGVTEAELRALGGGDEVGLLAAKLNRDGQLVAWLYAVGRDPSGALRMNPQRRVAILRADALRIEPAGTPYPVAPPAN
jgi:hypothetical protein